MRVWPGVVEQLARRAAAAHGLEHGPGRPRAAGCSPGSRPSASTSCTATASATAWLAAGEGSPRREALLRRALDEGVHALDLPAAGEVAVGQGRRCEIAVVRLAGAVDEAGYLAHNQSQAERGAEPVDHFCRRGWRALRNPSLDFDVWWYWAEYLDPTDESETAINPLVHYLLDGRHRGLLPLPQRAARPTYSAAAPPRRACLFAMYDPDGLVDDYVVAYVAELARHADVFVLADGDAGARTARPAVGVAPGRGCARTAARLRLVEPAGPGAGRLGGARGVRRGRCSPTTRAGCSGRSTRCSREMDARPCDFWGLQLTARRFEPEPCQPQSRAARRGEAVLAAADRVPLPRARARRLLLPGPAPAGARRPRLPAPPRRASSPQRDRANLVQKYETGTTQYLVGQGYDFSTWVPDLRPNHPIYGPGVFDLLAEGFPLFKRRFLVANPYDTPDLADWKQRILAAVPDAPVDMFERNLLRVADPDELARRFAIRPAG